MSRQVLKNLKLLKEITSKFADIRLYETEEGKTMMTLNTFVQLISGEDEEIYHTTLTMTAINGCPKAKKGLILGGADGCVAREIFKAFPDIRISLVDIDNEVLKLCMNNSRMVKLNKGSLAKVDIFCRDAKEWVKTCKDKFDFIICDFPDANDDELKKLYTKEFYLDTIKLLNKYGIISVQTNIDVTKDIENIFKDILGGVITINYKMPFLGEGIIVNGTKGISK